MAKIKKDTNLRKSILQAAITGQLISNVKGETKTGKELLDKIIEERNKKLLAQWEEAKKKNPKAKKPAPIVASEITEDEIPFEIPKSWCWCRLGEICNAQLGKTLDKSKNKGDEVPYLCSININWGQIDLEKVKTLKLEESEKTKYLLKKGDLLICEGGDVGRTAIWDLEKEMYYQNALHCVRFYLNLNQKYFYYILVQYKNLGILDKVSKGMTIKHLVQGALLNLIVPLPPLAVQNAIVAKLEEVLPLVDAYENAVLQKEELKTALPDKVKKAILQEAIQGKLTKSWRKTTTIEESGKQLLDRIIEERNAKLLADWEEAKKKNPKAKKPAPIVASEITEDEIPFEIPKSWCWCRLGEICKLTDGEKIQDIKLPLLDAKYLRGKKEAEYLSSGKLAKPNDLLILVDGENSGEVFINKEEGIMGSTFKKLNIVNELYLPYVLQFIALNKDLLRNSKKGAAIPHLNKDIFFGLLFPLPPLAEQEKIVEIIEQMLPLCEKLGG
ncbi:restriction endonuclease subunit S [Campylobacter lanienae]|uniref:restriction endonuclease subunit S n=1 Tax=Campylobacter lanienae TaxID=75658 RepID=UPI0015C519D4|nr:restriction endonuclease subunit S [Campylobacter lanienae]